MNARHPENVSIYAFKHLYLFFKASFFLQTETTIKFLLAAGFLLMSGTSIYAQVQRNEAYLPKFAIKTNALYWATSTPNLGFEVGLAKKLTLDISGNYNPWKFGDDRQIKHWLVQPELSFFGLHGHYGEMNVSNLNIFGMGHDRYDGNVYGAGISYGYQWIISKRWSMEATIGVGYAHLKYDKYARGDGGEKLGHNNRNYFGPTKVGLSFIYIIK